MQRNTRYVVPILPAQVAFPDVLQIGAGYTDDDGAKVAVSSQALAPAGIILDAELTLATPARLWYVSFP